MVSWANIENRAGLARITCGWKKPELALDDVLCYWRDVHSPAITRRAGVYDYRHFQFDEVRADLFAPIEGVDFECPATEQLMWVSDVRYIDEEGLAAFNASPGPEVKPHLLGDIDLIVDKSTTYRAVGPNARTYKDTTGTATPQGRPASPTFTLFFRQRSDEAAFRAVLEGIAGRWSVMPGVERVRLSLFDVPDMEAERKAGYPVKTHPLEQQYQACLELVLAEEEVAGQLFSTGDDSGSQISVIHAYPVRAVYTSVYGGLPTIVGLRGYAAHQAIEALEAANQKQPDLLKWMYGPLVTGGPVEADEQ